MYVFKSVVKVRKYKMFVSKENQKKHFISILERRENLNEMCDI